MTTEQREASRVYSAAYYAAHKEEIRARKATHYQDHKGEQRAGRAAYRAAHKEEQRTYGAAWYQENRDEIREKDNREHAEFTEWLQILRTVNGCEDCEIHEGRLLHHHVDPETRMYKVSEMYGCSIDTLEDELEKCVVLCHSCHMARHVEMRAA